MEHTTTRSPSTLGRTDLRFTGVERSSPLAQLSDRELEVLARIADGLSNEAIADALTVSTKTVEAITASVFRKLHLIESSASNRRVQAAVLYLRHAPDLAGVTTLPIRTSSFVGRRAELDELQRLLESHRCLTIIGPGGAGKTTLASVLAATWADGGKRLRYVDLVKVRRADLAIEELIDAFGIVAKDTKIGLRRVKSYIGADDFLVVFDNADDVGRDAAVLVDELVRLPAVRIVVTSRSPTWSAHEHVWIAPPMSLYDSESLLRERCTVELEAGECRRICVALDGLPLAIELVAVRLATASVEDVVGGLGSALPHVLTSGGDSRHASLRRALMPSYRDLSVRAQQSLKFLAVLPAGITAEGARSLLGEPGPLAAGDVELLTRVSLLSFDGLRYRMLEPIRQFALSMIGPSDWPQVLNHHAPHWVGWSNAIRVGVTTNDSSASFAALAAEQPNVEAAVNMMLEHGAVDAALRIVTLLAYPWSVSGGARGLDLALLALDASDVTVNGRWRGRALATIGGLGSLLASPARDWDAMLSDGIALLREGSDDAVLAAAYLFLSRHRQSLGDIDTAIELAARTGQHWLHGWSLVNKASLLTQRGGDRALIVSLLDEAEQIGREFALPVVRAASLMRRAAFAILEELAGRAWATPAEWRQWTDEAERIMRASGDPWETQEVVLQQCRTRIHDGDHPAVPALAAEAISVAASNGNGPILAEAIMLGAEFAARCHDSARANKLVDLAASVTTVIWNRRWLTLHSPQLVERLDRLMCKGDPRPDVDIVEHEALAIVSEVAETARPGRRAGGRGTGQSGTSN